MCLRLNQKINSYSHYSVMYQLQSIVCICSLLRNQKGKRKDYNHFNTLIHSSLELSFHKIRCCVIPFWKVKWYN